MRGRRSKEMIIKEIIVVEGKEDTRRLKEIFKNIDTIETRGSAIDKRTLDLIQQANLTRGVIIFTDPDYQGQKIRSIINKYVPLCKNAYIKKEKAISDNKKKVGIEHCKSEDIIDALSNLTRIEEVGNIIEYFDLYQLKLIGHSQSNELREYISEKLHLGYNNAKQFYKKVKIFNLSRETLQKLIDEYYDKVVK